MACASSVYARRHTARLSPDSCTLTLPRPSRFRLPMVIYRPHSSLKRQQGFSGWIRQSSFLQSEEKDISPPFSFASIRD